MKKIALVAALAACSNMALAEINAEVGITSDYRYNGVSQTERNPALQASVGYVHESGFYAELWGSNAHFSGADGEEGAGVELEIDATAGFEYEISDGLSLDVGIATYNYFGKSRAKDINYPELYVGVNLPTNTSLYFNYSKDYDGAGLKSYFIELGQEFELGDYTLGFTATHTKTSDKDPSEGYWDEDHDYYQHLEVSLAREWQGFDFKVAAIGTTIDRDYDKNARATALLTISKAWNW